MVFTTMLLLMIVTILLYISVTYQIVHEKISDLQDHHMLMPSTEEKKGNISQHHKAMFYDTQKEMIALTPSK